MDYAFVPGTSPYENLLRVMLGRRADTKVISKDGLTSLSDFFGELVTETLTVDDLVPGGHASDEGFLFIAADQSIVDPGTNKTVPVTYEMLDQANTSGVIKIPESITSSPYTALHIKGCRIGSDDALPFLKLLKEALSNAYTVTAPKYFHALQPVSGAGIFEYMAYSYSVMNPTAFTDRASLVDAFANGEFTDVLAGLPVPTANWDKWVQRKLKLSPTKSDEVKFTFPVTITPAAGGISAIPYLKARCRSRREPFTWTMSNVPTIPPAAADQLTMLKASMSAAPTMQDTHPYPLYARMHFTDFDSFWDGLTWKPSVNGSDLIGTGTHFVYTLAIPILKPETTTSELLFNFYPVTGTPVMNFKEDNATYDMFGTV
jgi:hypothetical protein